MVKENDKTEQHNRLFEEWEQTTNEYKGRFVRDGIIEEQLYKSALPKILFILKEPNDPGQEADDIREWWKDRKQSLNAFGKRLAELSYGLLQDFPPFENISTNNNDATYIDIIHRIALMNIKKSGGGGISKCDQMMDHAKMNINFLHREIKIIEPDIIITGTSWPCLRDEVFKNNNIEWKNSGYAIQIGRYNDAKVIDFYHPSSRNAAPALYSLLQNIVHSDMFRRL